MGDERLPGGDASEVADGADGADAAGQRGRPAGPLTCGDAASAGAQGGGDAATDGAGSGPLGVQGMVARDLAADDTDNDG